jgi:hypothetical protein
LPAINSAKCDASANLLGIPQHQQQLKKGKKKPNQPIPLSRSSTPKTKPQLTD